VINGAYNWPDAADDRVLIHDERTPSITRRVCDSSLQCR